MGSDAPTLPDIDGLADRLTGYRFPDGSVQFQPHEVWLGNDAMGVQASGTDMGPNWLLVLSVRGMGTSIAELLELADQRVEDGVLFGEMTIQQHSALRAETTYRVAGGIDQIRRRSGRSGTFDVLTFSLDISEIHGDPSTPDSDADGAGPVVGRVTNSFILPRRST